METQINTIEFPFIGHYNCVMATAQEENRIENDIAANLTYHSPYYRYDRHFLLAHFRPLFGCTGFDSRHVSHALYGYSHGSLWYQAFNYDSYHLS